MPGIRFLLATLALSTPAIAAQPAAAQDEFNAGSFDMNTSAEQARRCAEERQRNYGNENYRPSAGCRPNVGRIEDQARQLQGTAGIYQGGTLPPRTSGGAFGSGSTPQPGGTAGIYGPQPPPTLQGGVSNVKLEGGTEQGQQGAPGYRAPIPVSTSAGSAQGGASGGPRYRGNARIPVGRGGYEDYVVEVGVTPGPGDFGDASYGVRTYDGFYGGLREIGGRLYFEITGLRPRGRVDYIRPNPALLIPVAPAN